MNCLEQSGEPVEEFAASHLAPTPVQLTRPAARFLTVHELRQRIGYLSGSTYIDLPPRPPSPKSDLPRTR